MNSAADLDSGQENLCNGVAVGNPDKASTDFASCEPTGEGKQAACQRANSDMTLEDFCTCPITMQILEDPVVAAVIPALVQHSLLGSDHLSTEF